MNYAVARIYQLTASLQAVSDAVRGFIAESFLRFVDICQRMTHITSTKVTVHRLGVGAHVVVK